jgi:hypothetical protein
MKNISIIFFLIAAFQVSAQVGKTFPYLSAHKLDDFKVELPSNTNGKYTLLGMAYSKEAEAELATWYQPVYETFIHQDAGGPFEVEHYDIHLFLIPMFTGANEAAHGKAVQEMKKSVDKNLWKHVLVYKGDVKVYKDQLAMQKKEIPYIFLLDKTGKIVYATHGKHTDEKIEKIESFLTNEIKK